MTATLSRSLIVLGTISALLVPTLASAEYNEDCLHRAIDRRTDAIKSAYRTYADDVQRATDRLSDDQHASVRSAATGDRQRGMMNAQSLYSDSVVRASQRVYQSSQDAWIEYANAASVCEGYTANVQRYDGYQYQYQQYPYQYQWDSYSYPNNGRTYRRWYR